MDLKTLQTSCQLRLPQELNLAKLSDILTANIETALNDCALVWNPKSNIKLRDVVTSVLHENVVAFDLCGCSSVCDEQVQPAAWNDRPESALLSTEPADLEKVRRFHLRLPKSGLDTFGDAVARLILQSSGNSDSPHHRSDLKRVREALQKAIGPYLFMSPLCGFLDNCKDLQTLDSWD